MTRQARAVVIGGGIMGVSVAYHLAAEGWTDVILCEKGELTSGSTWHAAGQIARAVGSRTLGWVNNYSMELYQRLETETGQVVGWHGCGGLRVGYDDDKVDWLKSIMNVGRLLDLPMELVGPESARSRNPASSACTRTPGRGRSGSTGCRGSPRTSCSRRTTTASRTSWSARSTACRSSPTSASGAWCAAPSPTPPTVRRWSVPRRAFAMSGWPAARRSASPGAAAPASSSPT